MSNHTKGPWRVTPAGTNCRGAFAIQGEGGAGEVVAEVRKVWNYTGRAGNQPAAARQEANAALIAAAPELLAALRAIVATCRAVPGGDAAGALAAGAAAIAKAEGVQP